MTALCAACTSVPFEDRATDYNKSLASAAEKQMILNILRSAAREPMSFSLVSSVDSRSAGGAGIGMEIPIGPGAGPPELIPSIAFDDQTPRFSVSPQMKATFLRAVSRPLELGVLERILSRRFQSEQVLRLFISEIGWMSEPLPNLADTPQDPAFQRRLRLLLALGLFSEPLLGDNTLIEDLDQESVLELIEEVGVASERLAIVPDRLTGKFDVIGEPGGFRLCFQRPPILDPAGLSEQQIARAVDLTCRPWVVSQLPRADLGGRDLKKLTRAEKARLVKAVPEQLARNARFLRAIDDNERSRDDRPSLQELIAGLLSQSQSGQEDGVGEQELGRLEHFGGLVLTIRSPLEVMEYLGDLTRGSLAAAGEPQVPIKPNAYYDPRFDCASHPGSLERCADLILFALRQGRGARPGVSFDGTSYYLANGLNAPKDHSLDAISILTTLFAFFVETDDVDDATRVTILP